MFDKLAVDKLDRLLIFTRYPEPGTAKTRLIPALGAEGAATLYRQMAAQTLTQARSLQHLRRVTLEVQFTGGTVEQMQDWLGADLRICEQGPGDLGDRLAQAFQSAFEAGCCRAIAIGTDCPELNALLLAQAFRELQDHDLVLGPASDGGYYLIGLRRSIPELFSEIAWSTAIVLRQTTAIADRLGLTIGRLPMLSDVDRPEDLEAWETNQRETNQRERSQKRPKLSVIIPIVNEVDRLAATLATVQAAPEVEIIVVDGDSQDGSIALAEAMGVRVLQADRNRAAQMNTGAIAAQSDVLLFLHGDTHLPPEFDRWVAETLMQPDVVAGAFQLDIEGTTPGLELVKRGVNGRSRWLQFPYGDQAIFLKATTFWQLGGFPLLPMMEDFEFVRRLRRIGRVAIVPATVLTSGRRWKALGVVKTTLINQAAIAAYLVGVAPDRIARWYRAQSSQDQASQNRGHKNFGESELR